MTWQPLLLLLACWGVGRGVEGACPHLQPGLKAWSQPDTWGGSVPSAGAQVELPPATKVLLDVSPPPLGSLTVPAGSELVWGDVEGLTLSSDFILVLGAFHLGSQDCRFTKKAHIRLTGRVDSPHSATGFGKKFLGVGAEGTLELHGAEKKAWTKLIHTVPAASQTCGLVYDSKGTEFGKENNKGLQVVVWNSDGSVFDQAVFHTGENLGSLTEPYLASFFSELPQGKVVAVSVNRDLGVGQFPDKDWESIYSALETLGGLASGSSKLRSVGENQPYSFITRIGDASSTKEALAASTDADGFQRTPAVGVTDWDRKLKFSTRSGVRVMDTWAVQSDVSFRVVSTDVAYPVIKLLHDVSSWKAGDQVVVTSTDYDWTQAETFTIFPCDTCASNEIRLDGEFQNMHYGEITFGVDERAEVALLSRNILIEGIMESECLHTSNEEKEACELLGEDTNGGHVKANRGFASLHVEGVELYHMGSSAHLGRYPLHCHMCDDVDGAWFRNNSIHHTFARCVTIHGTDGLEVSDNVCYRHRGHGYFLEDSAEQRNILDGNIGIGTMHGLHLMSDRRNDWCKNETIRQYCGPLSTYWLTHPNNYIRNNVAAGSDGHGFMYAFARRALGPSKVRQEERGLVKEFSASQIPITQFFRNTAHSNRDRGLFIDLGISIGEWLQGVWVPENGVGLLNRHNPLVDPFDSNSEPSLSHIQHFTSYKNDVQDIWLSGGNIRVTQASMADSGQAFGAAHTSAKTWQELKDSVLIGESDNKGMGFTFSINGLTKTFPRSVNKNDPNSPRTGFSFFQGPVYLTNCYFNKYKHSFWSEEFDALPDFQAFRPGAAISFKHPSNPYPSSAHSSASGIKFGFCDETEGNHVFWGNESTPGYEYEDGMRQSTFHDEDGSVTGYAGSQAVRNIPFVTTPRCSPRPNWNMAVCPHMYAKVDFSGDDGAFAKPNLPYAISMHRDDASEHPFTLRGDRGLSYLVIQNKTYIVNFNGTSPTEVAITTENLQNGNYLRLGLCFPKDTTGFKFSRGAISRRQPAFYVQSIEALDSDRTGAAFFWDKQRGLLFFKLISNDSRVYREDCPGNTCPKLLIQREGGGNGPINCTLDAYGPYKKDPEPAGQPLTPKPCVRGSPDGLGAPIENPTPASQFSITCPAPLPTSAPGTRMGCYLDNRKTPEFPNKYQLLQSSQTPEQCVNRCRGYGYSYAGLQNGRECGCANSYGANGEDATGCTKPCTGNTDITCGGDLLNEVFSTGVWRPFPSSAHLSQWMGGKN